MALIALSPPTLASLSRDPVDIVRGVAERAAVCARAVRHEVLNSLTAQPWESLYRDSQRRWPHPAGPDDFADAYAQTLAHLQFAAVWLDRASAPTPAARGERDHGARREQRAQQNRRNQRDATDGTSVMAAGDATWRDFLAAADGFPPAADLAAVLNEVRQAVGAWPAHDDPFAVFSETFLAAFGGEHRRARGVYFTPGPLADYMVRSVDDCLQREYGLPLGLADGTSWGELVGSGAVPRPPGLEGPTWARLAQRPYVSVLDPALGTGTFLRAVMALVRERLWAHWRGVSPAMSAQAMRARWCGYVAEQLLPRLRGFEIMAAPHALCWIGLRLWLEQSGFRFSDDDRLRVELRDALGEPTPQQWRAPCTVVLGNPPYRGLSDNRSAWMNALMRGRVEGPGGGASYFEVDGEPLGERKTWLQDDYVRFFRLGQYLLEQSGSGVLAFVTNHSYLDNPTFRGMRQRLLETFGRISILDLQGNTLRNDGRGDQNVFEIKQGVSIGLFRRAAGPPNADAKRVDYAELRGAREEKLRLLSAAMPGAKPDAMPDAMPDAKPGAKPGAEPVATLGGRALVASPLRLQPRVPLYLFVPRAMAHGAELEGAWPLTEIMPVHGTGIITARDAFAVGFDAEEVLARVADLRGRALADDAIRDRYFSHKGSTKYPPGDTRGWRLAEARQRLRRDRGWRRRAVPYAYRPFDERWLYYSPNLVDWPRPEVMRHLEGDNSLALVTCRQLSRGPWRHIFPSRGLTDDCYVSNRSRERGYVFPLHLRPNGEANLAPGFLAAVAKRTSLRFSAPGGDLKTTFGPLHVLAYIYAVLWAPAYRARYADHLFSDFARVPLPVDGSLFVALCQLGRRLLAAHLLDAEGLDADANAPGETPGQPGKHRLYDGGVFHDGGDRRITQVGERGGGLAKVSDGRGRLYINRVSYFGGVSTAAWTYTIGGFQVCRKWLADRRRAGHSLSDAAAGQLVRVAGRLERALAIEAAIETVIETRGGLKRFS